MLKEDWLYKQLYEEIYIKQDFQEKELLELASKIYMGYTKGDFIGQVKWSNRLKTSGGNIKYDRKSQHAVIQINRKYFLKFGVKELIEILKHELAHYYLFRLGKMNHRHGQLFKDTLKEVFKSDCLTAKYNSDVYQHHYFCGKCGGTYRSIRKYRKIIYCGKCAKENDGKLHHSYRMTLKDNV
ncbi:MAG: SprT-like domain-containing protein [Bacillota bacterium]